MPTMVVNKSILDRVIYRSTKTTNSGTLLQDRLFEKEAHGIDAIDNVDFTSIDIKPLVNAASENNEEILKNIGEEGVRDHFYLSVVSSQLYHLMLNFVKIPTNQKITNEKTKLYVCSISFKDPENPSLNRRAYNYLCFLGLPLNSEVVIEASIYRHLTGELSHVLDISVCSEHEVNYKLATMDKIEDDYELMSITRQETYSKRCKEVLSYRQNNLETAKDNSRLDNLQYYLLEQQLCLGLYLSLQPVFALSIAKFNRVRKLADATGNLFFSLSLTNEAINDVDQARFIDIVHLMMDYGFYVSHDDIERNIRFSNNDAIHKEPVVKDASFANRELISRELGKNSMYSLLFRLLDESLAGELTRLDDLILSKKHTDFDAEIFKILS